MSARSHHLAAVLTIGALVLGAATWSAVDVPTAQATCATGSSVIITSPSSANSGPSGGIRTLRAYSTPSAASGISFMLVSPMQKPLGEAQASSSDWRLDWDSRDVPNGTYQLVAVAHFGTAVSLDCASGPVPINVANTPTTTPSLKAAITPNTWTGLVGQTATFNLDVLYTDQYGRGFHVTPSGGVQWGATIGTVTPAATSGLAAAYNAGPRTGTGDLKAIANHAGLQAVGSAAIKINATTTAGSGSTPTPTPAPTTATNSGSGSQTAGSGTPTPAPLTTEEAARLASMPSIFRPASPTNSAPVVTLPTLSCLEKAVGQVRFASISAGTTPATPAERALMAQCFSGAQPIPATLAPVAPEHLADVESTTSVVSLDSVKNRTTTGAGGAKVNGVLLSGKGAPNSTIFLYVFSDPLVLRAETDSQGKWNYVLETPLAAGNHEVYAVAEKDAGTFVRTSAVPITIAAAAPGAADGSLIVERRWSAAQVGFMGLAVLMILAAVGLVVRLQLRRRKPAPSAGPGASTPATPPAPTPAGTQPATATQSPAPAPVVPAATPVPAPAPTPAAPPAPAAAPPTNPPANGPQA